MTLTELTYALAVYFEPVPTGKGPQHATDIWTWFQGNWAPRYAADSPYITVRILKELMSQRNESGHILFMNDGRFSIDAGTAYPAEELSFALAEDFAKLHGIE